MQPPVPAVGLCSRCEHVMLWRVHKDFSLPALAQVCIKALIWRLSQRSTQRVPSALLS